MTQLWLRQRTQLAAVTSENSFTEVILENSYQCWCQRNATGGDVRELLSAGMSVITICGSQRTAISGGMSVKPPRMVRSELIYQQG